MVTLCTRGWGINLGQVTPWDKCNLMWTVHEDLEIHEQSEYTSPPDITRCHVCNCIFHIATLIATTLKAVICTVTLTQYCNCQFPHVPSLGDRLPYTINIHQRVDHIDYSQQCSTYSSYHSAKRIEQLS